MSYIQLYMEIAPQLSIWSPFFNGLAFLLAVFKFKQINSYFLAVCILTISNSMLVLHTKEFSTFWQLLSPTAATSLETLGQTTYLIFFLLTELISILLIAVLHRKQQITPHIGADIVVYYFYFMALTTTILLVEHLAFPSDSARTFSIQLQAIATVSCSLVIVIAPALIDFRNDFVLRRMTGVKQWTI